MTFDIVKEMIAGQLRVDASTITESSRLVEDLKADSANVMVMIMDLEDRFGITVEDDQIMRLKTVGDVVKYIDSLKVFSLLANVADVKSLVIHPATTTHSQMTPEELTQQHITPTTVRLSIGVEHIDDIIEDLRQAFEAI